MNGFDLQRETEQLILNRYAPASVVVNEQMKILQVRGDIDPYFKVAAGTPDLNLLTMARKGLLLDLRTAIYQAQTQNATVRKEGVSVESGGRSTIVNIEVIPFQPQAVETRYIVVLFEEAAPTDLNFCSLTSESGEQGDLDPENERLRQALATANQEKNAAQAHLQSLIEEQ